MELLKKNQMELLGTKWKEISLMKISLDRINSQLDSVEEMISELEDIAIEFIQNETERAKWQEK